MQGGTIQGASPEGCVPGQDWMEWISSGHATKTVRYDSQLQASFSKDSYLYHFISYCSIFDQLGWKDQGIAKGLKDKDKTPARSGSGWTGPRQTRLTVDTSLMDKTAWNAFGVEMATKTVRCGPSAGVDNLRRASLRTGNLLMTLLSKTFKFHCRARRCQKKYKSF